VALLPDHISFAEIAPVLCAGETVYKGLKMTDAKAGQWVVISGIGGLGHMAVQYAIAMGARVVVNALKTDPVAYLNSHIGGGGAHGVLVTAVSPKAFDQALGMVRRGGTMVMVGLPPGTFAISINDMVLKGITVRGSIVGTRMDLKEAVSFAADGKVKAIVETGKLENINSIFERMRQGKIEGHISIDFEETPGKLPGAPYQ
jgi:propanol-preferring alcohol dehydrogenase